MPYGDKLTRGNSKGFDDWLAACEATAEWAEVLVEESDKECGDILATGSEQS